MAIFKRYLSCLLITTMLIGCIPMKAFALQSNAAEPINDPSSKQAEKIKKERKILKEVVEKRESNTKHFLMDDFSYEVSVYPEPVHYLKNGQWKDIDNSLADAQDDNKVLSNKQNDFSVKISKDTKSLKLVSINKGDYEISWNLSQANNVKAEQVKPDISKNDVLIEKAVDSEIARNSKFKAATPAEKAEIKKTKIENEKKKTLTNLQSKVQFVDIYPSVDLQYDINGNKVKENIVIKKKILNPVFKFNLNVKNLIPKLNKDNTIVFYDKNLNKDIYKMEIPFMYDANHEESSKIKVTLNETKDGYELVIIPDKVWIDSASRTYPITIDPPVRTIKDSNNIQDAIVCSNDPENYSLSPRLRVGNNTPAGKIRSYIKFTLPTLKSGDMVTNASLELKYNSSANIGGQINVHKVTSDWNSSSLPWAESIRPNYNTIIEDYQIVNNMVLTWDITGIAKDWYNTGINYGVMLKNQDENAGDTEFVSSNDEFYYYRPYATINYINNSGLENYWTYHSQDAGRAGTGYINDFNGNLVFQHNDLAMSGNKMPVNVQHVFNSNDKNVQLGFGQGWRLNYSQRVKYQIIDGTEYYVFTDADGTDHYFKLIPNPSYTYQDDLNLGLTLKDERDQTYTVTDKAGNKVRFSEFGDIKYVSDKNNNTTNFGYGAISTGGTRNLTSLTDSVGRVTTLEYSAANKLISITDPSLRKTNYEYTNESLSKITYPDAKFSTYNYDASGNLLNAINYDGIKISYEYNSAQPYRVTKTAESNNATPGNELNIKYGNNSTSFTDESSRTNTYLFDNWGKTTTVKDSEDNAVNYKYADGLNTTKLGEESKLQKTTVNYLMDHNAEYNAAWTSNNPQAATYSSEDKYLGNQSLKIASMASNQEIYHSQYVTLAKGKTYTFSSFVKTNGITATGNAGAALTISYLNASSQWVYAPRKYINGTKDWDRYETTFTVAADAYSATNNNLVNVWVAVEVMNSMGTAYFDSMQLEEGSISNRYNLIENGDFRVWDEVTWNALYWNKNYGCDSGDYVAYDYGDHPKSLDKDVPVLPLAYKLNGGAGKNKGITQTLNMSGKSGESFVLGGWAKADSVPLSSSRLFELSVGFQKSGGAITWTSINFNPDTNEWQYQSGAVVSNMDYDKVWLYACYYDNANAALFDGIQLYKEGFGTSYKYNDGQGNVTSIVDLAKQTSNFQYDTNNDLIKSTDAKGNNFVYEYDNGDLLKKNHNLTKATTAENVVYKFTYDINGNPITSRVGDDVTFLYSNATYSTTGNYMKTLTDSSGNTATYNYNETKGILDSVIDPNGKTTFFSYDPLLDRLKSVSKVADGQTITNSYDYLNDRISAITHNGFSYNFGYDALGNNDRVDVGTQNLITNTYEAKTSRLLKSTYGNGQIVSSGYDTLDRVISKVYNGSARDNYTYDASGNLGYHEDLVNGTNYKYIYDTANRLVKVQDNKGSVLSYGFDSNNNTSNIIDKVNNNDYTTAYVYDKDNKPTTTTYSRATANTITQNYDISLGRVTGKLVNTGMASYNTTFGYLPGASGATTTKVGTITNNGAGISYTYDANGNIETITQNGQVIKYYYNELNEVIREDNQVLNKTITNTYDAGGNITNKTEYPYTTGTLGAVATAYPYVYGDTNWKDKLTSYNGNAITYDSIGNPLTYNGNTFTWEEGRQLSALSGNGNNISYKYNDAGIRTQKIVNGVTTNYHLVGNKVTYEDNGTDKIYYTYDASGHLVSMNLNGVEYYYIRNAQGDIIGLFDKTGTQVVTYTYDTCGKLISTTGSLASTVGVKNPYRYRGYRYDTETGLYYLQSRYYNADWGRFINADGLLGQTGQLLAHNMFAYCQNNAVNMSDPNGFQMLADDGGGNYVAPSTYIIPAILTGAIPGAADTLTALHLSTLRNGKVMIKHSQQALSGVGASVEFTTVAKSKPWLNAVTKAYKYAGGAATAVAFGYCVWDNSHYNHPVGRDVVDGLGIGACVLIGLVLVPFELPVLASVGLGALAGFGVSMGTSALKRRLFD